jgi:hypothetical protein
MTKTFSIILIASLAATTVWGQTLYVPEDIQNFYNQENIKSSFKIDSGINPYYLRGDFDGDKKFDYAFIVSERKTGKKGIIIYHTSSKKYFIVGAGKELATRPGDDYGWMDAWEIYCKKDVELGVGESKKIKLIGEAILITKLESSSGLIYWDGKSYQWYQQGD